MCWCCLAWRSSIAYPGRSLFQWVNFFVPTPPPSNAAGCFMPLGLSPSWRVFLPADPSDVAQGCNSPPYLESYLKPLEDTSCRATHFLKKNLSLSLSIALHQMMVRRFIWLKPCTKSHTCTDTSQKHQSAFDYRTSAFQGQHCTSECPRIPASTLSSVTVSQDTSINIIHELHFIIFFLLLKKGWLHSHGEHNQKKTRVYFRHQDAGYF